MAEDKKQPHGGWWGIVLIVIGAFLLLNNLGLLTWNWYSLLQAWPAALLIWGVRLLGIDERIKRLVILIIAAVVAVWVMGGFGSQYMAFQNHMMMRVPGERPYWR